MVVGIAQCRCRPSSKGEGVDEPGDVPAQCAGSGANAAKHVLELAALLQQDSHRLLARLEAYKNIRHLRRDVAQGHGSLSGRHAEPIHGFGSGPLLFSRCVKLGQVGLQRINTDAALLGDGFVVRRGSTGAGFGGCCRALNGVDDAFGSALNGGGGAICTAAKAFFDLLTSTSGLVAEALKRLLGLTDASLHAIGGSDYVNLIYAIGHDCSGQLLRMALRASRSRCCMSSIRQSASSLARFMRSIHVKRTR